MLPIIIFSNLETVEYFRTIEYIDFRYNNSNKTLNYTEIKTQKTCTILWPSNSFVKLEWAFIFYGSLVSFLLPISLISIFYAKIVLRLHLNSRKFNMQSNFKQRERRRVTVLVLLVIGIYVITYTPYWILQLFLLTNYIINIQSDNRLFALLSTLFNLLIYLNSALNPFLYAFVSEKFRTSFKDAIKCNKIIRNIRDIIEYQNRKRKYQKSRNLLNAIDNSRIEETRNF